jgi:hypothetical protein
MGSWLVGYKYRTISEVNRASQRLCTPPVNNSVIQFTQ